MELINTKMIINSEIQNFYENTNVFITGGTGFIGKVLIEKLLRSTEVSTIYLLIRNKKGKELQTRLNEIFDNPLFDCLKNEKQSFRDHVVAVLGDCSLPDLSLSTTDRQLLIDNVNVVIHAAANTNLDENIKLAYEINVKGTKNILELSKQIKELRSFIHVSTVYSNCHVNEIDEKIYDYSMDYKDIDNLLDKLTNNDANKVTPKLINNWPNSYTFTKALAESLVDDFRKDLPIGIFRPGIVLSTYTEPIKGWIDNCSGLTDLIVAASSGTLKIMNCDSMKFANIVPADGCVAGVLATAWDVCNIYKEKKSLNQVPVYNYVSTTENPIIWGQFNQLVGYAIELYPTSNAIRFYNHLQRTNNYLIFQLKRFCYDYLFAILIDSLSLITGRNTQLIPKYKKTAEVINATKFYIMKNLTFHDNNTRKLWEKMNDSDKKLFPMSLQTVSWLKYFKLYVIGVRTHLLNDSLETLEYARIRQKRFKITNFILNFLFHFFLMIALWFAISSIF